MIENDAHSHNFFEKIFKQISEKIPYVQKH